jgi:hypothetical protein
MRFARVDIRPRSSHTVSQIADRIRHAVPELRRGAIALVDSPRTPNAYASQRDLDIALRVAIAAINRSRSAAERITLALFPTQPREYFVRCVNDRNCKPHLIDIARQVLGVARKPAAVSPQRGGGWIFTRFMLAGFAAHRALERLGVDTFEAYPYLAFATWKNKRELLPPKSAHGAALIARQKIFERLARECRLGTEIPRTLDHADAAILAITARLSACDRGSTLLFESAEHGRFVLALHQRDRAAWDRASALHRA